MIRRTAVVLAVTPWALGATLALGIELGPSPQARAIPAPSVTMTVDGIDYPVCAEEDCSDQPGQIGVWYSKHDQRWLLELGEGQTYVVDSDPGDLTYCPTDGVWSRDWHWCPR